MLNNVFICKECSFNFFKQQCSIARAISCLLYWLLLTDSELKSLFSYLPLSQCVCSCVWWCDKSCSLWFFVLFALKKETFDKIDRAFVDDKSIKCRDIYFYFCCFAFKRMFESKNFLLFNLAVCVVVLKTNITDGHWFYFIFFLIYLFIIIIFLVL